MTFNRKIRIGLGRTLLATALTMLPLASAQATTWTVDHDKSVLGFEFNQAGTLVQGTFNDWSADIDFDPDNLSAASIKAKIKTGSALTGNGQFDGLIPTAQWFDVDQFPVATFQSDTVQLIEGNIYEAAGTLSLRGITQPATLRFSLDIQDDTATATGSAVINRTLHKVGDGVAPDSVGIDVTVTLDLTASK